jgi:uncharacterized protein YydD (DUF2326 family)
VRDYDDLLEFNRRIHTERQAALRERAITLRRQIAALEQANAVLSDRRKEILQVHEGDGGAAWHPCVEYRIRP